MGKLEAAAASQCEKDNAWRNIFPGNRGMSSILRFQALRTFPNWMDALQPAVFGPTTQGPQVCKLPLAWAGYPNLPYASRFPGYVAAAGSAVVPKAIGGWGFSPLTREAVYISRQSNKRSARFASSKFPHRFLLSLLISLASEDDISTLSSSLSLAFPLPPLLGRNFFHPPWCLPAQRAAPGLSSPK